MSSVAQGLLGAGMLAGVGAYGFWFALRSLARCHSVEDTPTARIRSAAQGYAGLSGLGSPPAHVTIRAPLTGQPCVWWHYRIEQRRSFGLPREWSVVDEQTSEAPFLIDDSTGQCLIDPGGADVVPHTRIAWRGQSAWPEVRLPASGGLFGKLLEGLLASGSYRYLERRLEAGRPVYAFGVFRTRCGVCTEDTPEAVAQLLHEWKADQAALLERFDRNHDGQIDQAEWEQVRAAALAQVQQQRLAAAQEHDVATLGEPADGRAFLLAGAEPRLLVRRYRGQALCGFALFLGSVLAASALLRAMG